MACHRRIVNTVVNLGGASTVVLFEMVLRKPTSIRPIRFHLRNEMTRSIDPAWGKAAVEHYLLLWTTADVGEDYLGSPDHIA